MDDASQEKRIPKVMWKDSCLAMEWRLACREAGLFSVGKWLVYDCLKNLVKCMLRRNVCSHEDLDFSKLPAKENGSRRVIIASQDCGFTSGAYRSCVAMARELRQRHGFDVIVVLAYHNEAERCLVDENIPFLVIPSSWWLVSASMEGRKSYREISRYFKKNHEAVRQWCLTLHKLKPDIVHINSMSCYVGGVAAWKLGVPIVWHMRDLLEEDHGFKIYNRDLGLKLVGSAEKMIAVSDCVAAKYSPLFGADKVVRVYNGVDTMRFYRPQHTILGYDVVTLLFLGAFQLTKGHVEFAQACAELYRCGRQNFRVWFVGGGSEKIQQLCDAEFARVGMQNRVVYWGRQSCPEKYLEQADIAFMCARCEAFGRVTVEMMLSGCLVIGANTGGTVELIRDGETGILFDRSTIVESLVGAVERALTNVENSRSMAAAGREFAFKNMTSEKNAEGVAKVYREVVE